MTILNNNTNKMSQEFAEWLKTTRKAKGITQLSLAQKASISKAYVGHLENKRPHTTTNALPLPKREVVIAIAKALDTDTNEVLTIAGYATDSPLPPELIAVGFDGLDNDDIKQVANH